MITFKNYDVLIKFENIELPKKIEVHYKLSLKC